MFMNCISAGPDCISAGPDGRCFLAAWAVSKSVH